MIRLPGLKLLPVGILLEDLKSFFTPIL